MGLPDKSASFEFLKDYKSDAKKGEIVQGYYADDWKDIEFRKMNSLGLVSKVFYAPMSEIDSTFKKSVPKAKPKTPPKEKLEKIEKPTTTQPTTDTKPVVEEKKSIFTTKNIIIGVVGLGVLFLGIRMIRKKK